ncbi:MAG: DEAD/DEAH box helicase [Silvanigrellales bacterium]|nr:DEAD/DEAH box helicase [Silvanigrellales bacterium]
MGRKQRKHGSSGGGRGHSRDEDFLRAKGAPPKASDGSGSSHQSRRGGPREGSRGTPREGGFRDRFREGSKGEGGVDFDGALLGRFREEQLVAMVRRTDQRLKALLKPVAAGAPSEDALRSAALTMGLTAPLNPALPCLNSALPPQQDTSGSALTSTPSGVLQPSRSYLGKRFARPVPASQNPNAEPGDAQPKKALPAEPKLSSLFSTKTKEPTVTEGGLRLDAWQAEALEALLSGANIVVDAPTSAGKTRVIEALLEHRMKEGLKLTYTSPVKSLSNDKYREFSEKYGKDKVGINTGDFKENLGAPIILSTLETYRNSLLGVEPNMSRRVVVYDEYHYLQDESRGSAWEESIILTPKESQLVLLSASVPNAEDFATWIEGLYGKPCKVIRVSERPVPLVDVVHTRWGWILADELGFGEEELAKYRRLLRTSKTRRFLKQKEELDAMLLPVQQALERNMGPVVVYAGRRAAVEGAAHAFAKFLKSGSGGGDWKGPEAERLHARIADLPGWDYVPSELQKLIRKHGIAYHHSGMIPPGRVAIETLLKEGCLRVCTGTMGISLGVNFAVRSAVISDETRPSEGGETRYSNSEILQMLGRAGRRGNDKQGFSLWVNVGRYAEQKPRAREACTSSLKFDPTTVLGILGQHEDLSYLSDFYRKSFFMRGKDAKLVLVEDHDLVSGLLYGKKGHTTLGCNDIPRTFARHLEGRPGRSNSACTSCPARPDCHPLMEQARQSTLNRIVTHLRKVGALDGHKPSKLGQLARHFPQAGGLIVAKWIASGAFGAHNFRDLMQAMACFCSAHFKDIPDTYADADVLKSLGVPKLIETFYPEELFPELYDDPPFRSAGYGSDGRVFREANMAAGSLVAAWIHKKMSWDELVDAHTSKYFSAGDCMMVLFRFSTFLQSCARLQDMDKELASKAKDALKTLLRDPLDARNRMLVDAEPETTEVDEAGVEIALAEQTDNGTMDTAAPKSVVARSERPKRDVKQEATGEKTQNKTKETAAEAGAVPKAEAGAVPKAEAGAVPKAEAGAVPKAEAGAVVRKKMTLFRKRDGAERP